MDWASEYGVEAGDVVSILAVDHVFYDKEMRTGGSLAWNDYNPGNIITHGGEAVQYGAFPGKANGRFAIFPDEATGFEAIRSFLRRRQKLSILAMMKLYAPDGDGPNDASAYAGRIADALGVGVDTPVSEIGEDGLTTFAQTVQQVEGWNAGTSYSTDDQLPDDITTWLATFPDPAERAANDQPFAAVTSTGPGVANLQQKLADLGYDIGAGGADGQFGPGTKAAVAAFQSDNGLSPDGVCGHDTWVALVG